MATSPSRFKRVFIITAVSSLALTACASGSGSEGGAIQEQSFRTQAIYGPDNSGSKAMDAFAQQVATASDGALNVDVSYASAITGVPEQEEAVKSGLLDIALLYPVYSPDAFPISNVYSDLAFLGPQTPLEGLLVSFAAAAESGFHPAHMDELRESGGIEPILPLNGLVPNYHLLCKDQAVTDIASAQGLRVRVSGQGFADEVSALGMQPVQLAGPEIYEGLERGAIDCNLGALGLNHSQGLTDLVDHYTIDSQVPFLGWNSGAFGVASDRWDDLPVEAQRIIWDATVEHYIPRLIEGFLTEVVAEMNYASESGVQFHELDDEAREALEAHRESVLDEQRARAGEVLPAEFDGDEFVDAMIDNSERWADLVAELGYSDDEHPTYDLFAAQYADGIPDLAPYFEMLRKEVFDPHRP